MDYLSPISAIQDTGHHKNLHFDPDSSPDAWNYYRQIYNATLSQKYDFTNLHFYKYAYQKNRGGKWTRLFDYPPGYTYMDAPSNRDNRLAAYPFGTNTKYLDGNIFLPAVQRLSGETDFNFNESTVFEKNKYGRFKAFLEADGLTDYIKVLDECRNNHHTLSNFSLMPVMGNLQKIKGKNSFDRFDTFLWKLSKYFNGDIAIIDTFYQQAGEYNAEHLFAYLNQYKDIYSYCEAIYFIDSCLVDKMIDSGKRPMRKGKDVIRYMNLAQEYWEIKKSLLLE